jgi:hypothetical protein
VSSNDETEFPFAQRLGGKYCNRTVSHLQIGIIHIRNIISLISLIISSQTKIFFLKLRNFNAKWYQPVCVRSCLTNADLVGNHFSHAWQVNPRCVECTDWWLFNIILRVNAFGHLSHWKTFNSGLASTVMYIFIHDKILPSLYLSYIFIVGFIYQSYLPWVAILTIRFLRNYLW